MNISDRSVKRHIYDVVFFSDKTDERGVRIPRGAFDKNHYEAVLSLREKFSKDIETSEDGETFIAIGESQQNPEYKAVITRLSDAPLEITDSEVAAVRFYFNETNTLCDYGIESFNSFKELFS